MAAGDGLSIMIPTSFTATATSATQNANGGIDFDTMTSLSLNGVFDAAHRYYQLRLRAFSTSGDPALNYRLRVGGVDNTDTEYIGQFIYAAGGTIGQNEIAVSTSGRLNYTDNTLRSGVWVNIYSPYEAVYTLLRTSGIYGQSNAEYEDVTSKHRVASSFDGITIISSAGITGSMAVFGYEES